MPPLLGGPLPERIESKISDVMPIPDQDLNGRCQSKFSGRGLGRLVAFEAKAIERPIPFRSQVFLVNRSVSGSASGLRRSSDQNRQMTARSANLTFRGGPKSLCAGDVADGSEGRKPEFGQGIALVRRAAQSMILELTTFLFGCASVGARSRTKVAAWPFT